MSGDSEGPDHRTAVYGITVAAGLVGTGVQNLRAYERAGLVDPHRTGGGTRLYSQEDIERLTEVQVLLRRGLNLVGIAMVFELREDNRRLRRLLDEQIE
ncbi:MAG: MerR family transcriptional regulator [Microlunatus sp.]